MHQFVQEHAWKGVRNCCVRHASGDGPQQSAILRNGGAEDVEGERRVPESRSLVTGKDAASCLGNW